MASPDALYAALDLFDRPSLVVIMRTRALPPNPLALIQIAAGAPEPIARAIDKTGRSATAVRAAAIFYIRQVMWGTSADSYRILGVNPEAPQARIAEQVRWLMKWLHPDVAGAEVGPEAAARVLRAWETVKTADRRKNYDRFLSHAQSLRSSGARPRRAIRVVQRPVPWVGSFARRADPAPPFAAVKVFLALTAAVQSMLTASATRLRWLRLDARSRGGTPTGSLGRSEVRGAVGVDLVEDR